MHDDETHAHDHRRNDPLALRSLPQLTPEADGWPAIRAALQAEPASGARRGRAGRAPAAWLAIAACLVLVVGVLMNHQAQPPAADATPAEHLAGPAPADPVPAANGTAESTAVEDLVVLSQLLERRLRGLRARTGTMPAGSAAYVAELEDLITRVDSELSDTPDAPELWSQRVNLLLDLEVLFQHQFDEEYGRMASL